MRKTLMTSACVLAMCSAPAFAQHRGGGFGAAFGGAALGGAVGSVLGNVLSQPQAPAPVYVAPPPVIYERRVSVAPTPVYVAPVQHIVLHGYAGPGFACYDNEANPVNRIICGSEDLSAAALALTQAIYAATQQTPYNAPSLRAEYASFMQGVRSNCAPYSYQQQVECVSGMLSHDRDVIVGRLTGPYADEANRPVVENVRVQQRLHDIGLLQGAADGVYGDGTRRAMASWQSGQGRQATGVLTNEEVAMLTPGYQAPAPYKPAPPAATPIVQASTAPVAAAPAAASDPMGGVHENMPYALARPKLFAAGWQTQFFKPAAMSDDDRDARSWFTDHHITEVEDCSSSGCKMQFHNMDGRMLYVYTQSGSHASDAYRGAGPSVIAYCLDMDDITCPAPAAPTVRQASK